MQAAYLIETETTKSFMKYLLIFFGIMSLSLGIVGIFLPVLPTTPFLLLSAALFARSSEQLYNRLLSHPVLGEYIRDFLKEKAIPLRIKIISVSIMWIAMLCTIFFVVNKIFWLQILLSVIAAGITIHILSYKTKNRPRKNETEAKPNKVFLYSGLGILLIAFTFQWAGMSTYYFWVLLSIAIVFKAFFLVSVFRLKGFKPSLWLYFILAGVAMILISLLFKTIFPIPVLYKILFYGAISLKITGLILMILSKMK
jgi:uncharacterized membrane protein YbaN (DUF454 family)